MRLTLFPAALVALAPASAFAVHYLSAEQAAYIGVPVEGPYKPDSYRY